MLQQEILAFARDTGALRPDHVYLVGVSGGVDSVALLHAMHAVAPRLGFGLHVAHLDHGLRADAGAADATFVLELAREWGLPMSSERADVRAYAEAHRLSEEAAAREVRYAFFARAAEEMRASAVVVAHTADDQVETVLLHFLRGTGIVGLRGMEAQQRLSVGIVEDVAGQAGRIPATVTVLRPLLRVWREQVEGYAREHSLVYRQDASNEDPRYLRNRIRAELIPLLETYNPAVRGSLWRLARLAAADWDVLAAAADREWATTAVETPSGVTLTLENLIKSPVALQRLMIRRAFAVLVGSLRDLEARHVDAALALASSGRTGALVDLPAGVVAARTYGRLIFSVSPPGVEPLPVEGVGLRVPGTTKLDPGGWEVIAEVLESPYGGQKDALSSVFDLDRVGRDLVVRRRRPGDRLRPQGLGGSKKLQDIMVDAKVPRWERDAVPLLASATDVVWAVGLAVDERALPDATTSHYLRVRFRRRGME